MKLIKEWKEGNYMPAGLSYRHINGATIYSGSLQVRFGRFAIQVGFTRYKRFSSTGELEDNYSYVADGRIKWL